MKIDIIKDEVCTTFSEEHVYTATWTARKSTFAHRFSMLYKSFNYFVFIVDFNETNPF